MSEPDIFALIERIHAIELKMARYSVITAIASAVSVLIGQRVVTLLL